MVQNTQTALETYQPSNNEIMNHALTGLEASLLNAATMNANAVLDSGYTEAERQAFILVEELKLINGVDLAAVLMRGKLIRQIEEGAIWTIHPGQYSSREELIRDQGISFSEYSNIKDLTMTIFPWMEEHGLSIAETWEQIGKSNFREMVPVLRTLITGEPSSARTINQAAERLMDDVVATANASGQQLTEEQIRTTAVTNLLEAGGRMNNRQLRETIRPERTPSIELFSYNTNGERLIMARVSEEQWNLLQRRLNGYMDPFDVELPNDPEARRLEAARIPPLRSVFQMFGE